MNKNHNNEPLMSIGLILPEDNQNNVSITLFGEKFSLLIDNVNFSMSSKSLLLTISSNLILFFVRSGSFNSSFFK